MFNASFRQIYVFLSILLFLTLLMLGITPFGRRLALGMAGPFVMTWQTMEDAASKLVQRLRPARTRQKQFDLQARLRQAEIELLAQETLRQENAELRRILQLEDFPGWQVLVAPVASRDPISWNWNFTISKGAADGVTVGAAVLSGQYVVGRVSEVFQHSAIVETVAAPGCRVSVMLGGTTFTGISQGAAQRHGQSPPRCQIDFLPREAASSDSSLVFTSGLGGWLPPGLPVGIIIPDDDGVAIKTIGQARASATMAPLANFAVIRFVVIVCPISPKLNP